MELPPVLTKIDLLFFFFYVSMNCRRPLPGRVESKNLKVESIGMIQFCELDHEKEFLEKVLLKTVGKAHISEDRNVFLPYISIRCAFFFQKPFQSRNEFPFCNSENCKIHSFSTFHFQLSTSLWEKRGMDGHTQPKEKPLWSMEKAAQARRVCAAV